MKKTLILLVVVIVAVGVWFFLKKDAITESLVNSPVKVTPISHATMILEWGDDVIYVDPTGGDTAFEGKPAPTLILITDIHGDHLSTSTLKTFTGNYAAVVPKAVKNLLKGTDIDSVAQVANNGDTLSIGTLKITAMPMYNLPESSTSPHTKGRGNGYLIEKDGYRVYIAGDTSGIPEMRNLDDIDMAFIPMNLPYTMSVEEAADAALDFHPVIVYPYHYRGQAGLSDVEKFKELVNLGDPTMTVKLENWYNTN